MEITYVNQKKMYLSLLVTIFGFGCVEIGKIEATGGGAVGGTLIILEL